MNQTINQQKSGYRKWILSRRLAGHYPPEAHTAMCQGIITWLEETAPDIDKICLYYPFRNEPDLIALRNHTGLRLAFYLPVMKANHQMAFHRWRQGSLIKNSFGIQEPDPQTTESMIPDHETLVLCPALALDLTGNRLGYGGGYYDRFFEPILGENKKKQPVMMGAVWDEFFFDQPLPAGNKDMRMNWIATETNVYKAQTGTRKDVS